MVSMIILPPPPPLPSVSEKRIRFNVPPCALQVPKLLQCIYWNQGHPDKENQSEGRTETIDSNILASK